MSGLSSVQSILSSQETVIVASERIRMDGCTHSGQVLQIVRTADEHRGVQRMPGFFPQFVRSGKCPAGLYHISCEYDFLQSGHACSAGRIETDRSRDIGL